MANEILLDNMANELFCTVVRQLNVQAESRSAPLEREAALMRGVARSIGVNLRRPKGPSTPGGRQKSKVSGDHHVVEVDLPPSP
jgi:hypothetical protein